MDPQVKKFLEHGRLTRAPRRWDDRVRVYEHLADRVFGGDDTTLTETEVMARLIPLADDPISVRRGWIDMRLAQRTADGSQYWRLPGAR